MITKYIGCDEKVKEEKITKVTFCANTILAYRSENDYFECTMEQLIEIKN